eukprot:gene4045-5063_t
MKFKITKDTLKKSLVMFLIANLGYGLQLAYSAPVALSRTFYDEIGISETQYGFLFTFYSLPNLFMIIIGGILIDIIGTNKVSTIFCGIACFSTILTVLSIPHFEIIIIGRFFLGMGGETLLACATTMIPLWYASNEVPICMGFLASWFYWGNLTALVVLPAINKSLGFKAAIDHLRWSNQNQETSKLNVQQNENLLNQEESSNSQVDLENQNQKNYHTMSKMQEFKIKLKQIYEMSKKLSARFWLLSVICFIGFYTMFGLAIIGTDVLQNKFGYSEQKSAMIMASEAIINGILPLGTGWVITNIRGRKIQIMILACALLGLGTFFLNVTDVFPLPWIILCGIGFALLNTTLMSCVPLLVEFSIVGTAYGIICTAYNLNIFLFPPILDKIKQSRGNYKIPLALLTGCSVIAIILLIVLKIMDQKVPLSQSLDSPYSTAGEPNTVSTEEIKVDADENEIELIKRNPSSELAPESKELSSSTDGYSLTRQQDNEEDEIEENGAILI